MANKQQMRDALIKIRAAMETGPATESLVMKAWDKARRLLLKGNKSDLPRMCFESVVDQITEWCDEGLSKIEYKYIHPNAERFFEWGKKRGLNPEGLGDSGGYSLEELWNHAIDDNGRVENHKETV